MAILVLTQIFLCTLFFSAAQEIGANATLPELANAKQDTVKAPIILANRRKEGTETTNKNVGKPEGGGNDGKDENGNDRGGDASVEEDYVLIVHKTLDKKTGRSTSSSSGEIRPGGDSSLQVTDDDSSSNEKTKKNDTDLKGWRKLHRRCVPCPVEMKKKWREPSIRWICGGYQRARRSFKSACMMRYRNCQDGTMFVKIHDNRCGNGTGTHFFYDYKAQLSVDSSDSAEEDSESAQSSSSSDSKSRSS